MKSERLNSRRGLDTRLLPLVLGLLVSRSIKSRYSVPYNACVSSTPGCSSILWCTGLTSTQPPKLSDITRQMLSNTTKILASVFKRGAAEQVRYLYSRSSSKGSLILGRDSVRQ